MRRAMGTRDRLSVLLLVFYVLVAETVELHWLLSFRTVTARNDFIGRFWAVYGRADSAYYDAYSSFVVGIESFHVYFTVSLYLLLLYAIYRRKSYRYPLQLAVSSYVSYSTALYLLSNHVGGYAGMHRHVLGNFLILYLANLPWLLGNLLLAGDAFRAAIIRFREAGGNLAEAG